MLAVSSHPAICPFIGSSLSRACHSSWAEGWHPQECNPKAKPERCQHSLRGPVVHTDRWWKRGCHFHMRRRIDAKASGEEMLGGWSMGRDSQIFKYTHPLVPQQRWSHLENLDGWFCPWCSDLRAMALELTRSTEMGKYLQILTSVHVPRIVSRNKNQQCKLLFGLGLPAGTSGSHSPYVTLCFWKSHCSCSPCHHHS